MADENLDMFGNPIESSTTQELDLFGNPIEQKLDSGKDISVDDLTDQLNQINTQGYVTPDPNKSPELSASIDYDPNLVGDNVVGVNKPTGYPTIELSTFNRLGDLALAQKHP